MKHVLLAIDRRDDRAIAQAETIQELFDPEATTAHLFHDFTDNPEGASVTQVASIRSASDMLEETGFPVEYHEASGDPSDSIIRVADELDIDALCIAGRQSSPVGKAVFGSVSQDVILGTERPVIVCSPENGG